MLTMQQFFFLLREPELVRKSCRVTVSSDPETPDSDPMTEKATDSPKDFKIVNQREIPLV